jgi:hypothetical protein
VSDSCQHGNESQDAIKFGQLLTRERACSMESVICSEKLYIHL